MHGFTIMIQQSIALAHIHNSCALLMLEACTSSHDGHVSLLLDQEAVWLVKRRADLVKRQHGLWRRYRRQPRSYRSPLLAATGRRGRRRDHRRGAVDCPHKHNTGNGDDVEEGRCNLPNTLQHPLCLRSRARDHHQLTNNY
ncbi:hypothetical protein CDL15_Pgr004103 [Punica granatum]|uniref:Uncharacterized protein n=1 Tax=Punica granatum TaxID=22663 RepID=A0A218XFH4_PUNGR|nr:hypothetical protein CDL15_Pgr004103 [Punica granatum]